MTQPDTELARCHVRIARIKEQMREERTDSWPPTLRTRQLAHELLSLAVRVSELEAAH